MEKTGKGRCAMKQLKWLPVLMMLIFLIGCGSGGGQETIQSDEYVVLRVLTESTTVDGMQSQVNEMISRFEAEHEHVNLILETLPAEDPQRQKALPEIYVQNYYGEGPDIYLLPAGSSVTVAKNAYLTTSADPLFDDVANTMHKGTFADISAYYDADEELYKDALQTGVMDAGLVGDARYVLPLRYSIPVVYADADALDVAGIEPSEFENGVLSYFEAVAESGDAELAKCALTSRLHASYFLNFFHNVIDYGEGKVTLKRGEVALFLKGLTDVWYLAGQTGDDSPSPHLGSYISTGESWLGNGSVLVPGRLESALDAAAIAKVQGVELAMIPLASTDGTLVADVTWYGAVGANCEHSETAYEFLRMFLTEEAQWEQNRPRSGNGMTSGLIGTGWPVRSAGSVVPLWDNLQFQTDFYIGQEGNGWEDRANSIRNLELTDEDLEILSVKVDKAVFSGEVELTAATYAHPDDSENRAAYYSAQVIRVLYWYLNQLQ